MKAFFMTFGQSHPLKNKYVGIIAPTYEHARAGAFRTFGEKFAFIYEALDLTHGLESQVMNYGISPAFHFRSVVDEYETEPDTDYISESLFAETINLQRIGAPA